jgi:hypothetical protein
VVPAGAVAVTAAVGLRRHGSQGMCCSSQRSAGSIARRWCQLRAMASPRIDSAATAQPLAHRCRLKVPRPAAQEMDTVDADTYLGMEA